MNNSTSKTQPNLPQEGDIKATLFSAAENGNRNIIMNSIDRWGHHVVNFIDENKRTPLHVGAKHGHKGVVEVLLINNAINTPDHQGLTPLHLAAIHGQAEVAKLLLKHKNNVNPDKVRLDSAVPIPYECDVNTKDFKELTPLHYACQNGHKEVAEVLLIYNADVNAETKNGCSQPLHLAARNNRPELARVLLEHGADASAKNKRGKTPLQEAAERGCTETVNALKDPYYKIESQTEHKEVAPKLPPRLNRLERSRRTEKKGLIP